MSLFNDKVNTILEATNLDANELKPGDICLNTNKDCDHFMSKGIVLKRTPFKNTTGTVGNLVRYMVLNKGKKFKPGDILDKTEIQLSKAEDEEGKVSKLANMVQGALDIVGLEPTIGTAADVANTGISLVRALKAAVQKEPDKLKRHMINAGISAISIIPAGDLAKLIKLRRLRKGFTKGVRAGRQFSKNYKQKGNRFKITDSSGYGKPREYEVTEQLKPRPHIKADPKELAMGIKVEKEHTTSEKAAKTIALQHLAEDPKYYSKLKKVEGNVHENYADGKVKGKSRPGRVKRSGASCKGSVTSLRSKAKKAGGEKGKMYHWCANMKGGRKK